MRSPADEYAKQLLLLAPERATLAVALGAALAARGWSVIAGSPSHPWPADEHAGTVLIVEDDEGRTWLPAVAVRRTLVAVGSVRSLAELLPMAARGAIVLNQAAPVLVLTELIETALAAPDDATVTQHEQLRRRHDEATGLARLTRAEAYVLDRLVDGVPAGRIADESHHSIHTVRSQIKSILAKLGVTNQLAAVAIVHRSGATGAREIARATFTNFGDDPPAHPAEH